MAEKQICYRKITHYKYQLRSNYSLQIDIKPQTSIETSFVDISTDGLLIIKENYAWDGPSGPTLDTKTFMRASLVHDALYQLIRLGKLQITDRDYADKLLKSICIEDGMAKFRAAYVYYGVHLFGKFIASKPMEEGGDVIYAP